MPATITRLDPGESAEFANGYIARSYRVSAMTYYAERFDKHGNGMGLSPYFATFAAALRWLNGNA